MSAPSLRQDTENPVDNGLVYRAHFDAMTRRYLRGIVTDELIAEHERNPSGRHGEALGRILAYFRRLPPSGQYLLRQMPGGGYGIVRMPIDRRKSTELVGSDTFPTLREAYHQVFLFKLNDMMEADHG